MKELTLQIAESRYEAFLAFIKTLDYVKVEDEVSAGTFINDLSESLLEVKDIREGKTPSKSIASLFEHGRD